VASRGEIWFARLPTEPSDKSARPVIIVSVEARNQSPRAATVLVVPLSTTPKRAPTHIELHPGETGLREISTAKTEEISTVRKEWLILPRSPLRKLGESRLRQIASAVQLALGYPLD
jgi:mRNA interferase MazF